MHVSLPQHYIHQSQNAPDTITALEGCDCVIWLFASESTWTYLYIPYFS